ncbi:2-oxo acid dehydrogenase subunit E2 [Spirillospora sp. NPDC052242]
MSGRPRGERFPGPRRHTLYFLEEIRAFSPVFLDTEVDMSGLLEHRRTAARRLSVVTYTVCAAGRVLAGHPEANAAIRGRFSPRVARDHGVHAKVTLDKLVGGRRAVLSTVLPDVDRAAPEDVQDRLEHFRDGDPDRMEEFAGVRLLHRLPVPVGRAAFRRTVRPLRNRPERFGTFAVTSLGHRPVDGFHSVGGTTITLGLGRIADRPVARDGRVVVAPTMRLSLAFDHRVIDGAEAADVLAEIRAGLEEVRAPEGAGKVPLAGSGTEDPS